MESGKAQVLLEDLHSQFKVFGEAMGGQTEKIGTIDKKIDVNTEMVAKNAVNIEIIKQDIQFIKQELGHKVDQDEFEALEKRVMFLERKFGAA